MQPSARLKAALTAADTYVGPVHGNGASLSVFVAGSGTGTLTLQCRPTPSGALPGTSVAGNPPVAAGTAEPWFDMPDTIATGLTVIAAVPGAYDFRVGYKSGATVTGSVNVYLNASN